MPELTFTDIQTGKSIRVHPAETFHYGSSRQEQLAKTISAKFILVTGDNRGRLPVWTKRVLMENGLWYCQIGRTTYKTNVFAIYEVRE